ncbi:MAG: type II toxin-antitoxin system HicB family antitoxin [Candidatus Nealsonbacteria bacterium]
MIQEIKKKIFSYTVIYQAVFGGGYIAFVPSLSGCHTQGDTLEEAEKNIKEAIQLYLESLDQHREKIPEEMRILQGKIEVTV